MSFKKVLLAFLLVFACFSFACKEKVDTEQVALDTFLKNLYIPDLDAILGNVTLESEYQFVYECEWEIIGTDKATIGTNRSGKPTIFVDRPAYGEDGIEFVLKVTVTTISNKTGTKEFDCYIRPHQAEFELLTCAEAIETTANYIAVQGIVTYTCPKSGFWITDSTNRNIYIYTITTPEEMDVYVGDEVFVVGTRLVFYDVTVEITSPLINLVKAGNNSYNYNGVASEVDIEFFGTLPLKVIGTGGEFYKFGGYVVNDPNNRYTYGLQSSFSNKAVTIYDNFLDKDAINFFKENKGNYVEGIFLLHDVYSGLYFRFSPVTSSLKVTTAPTLSDEEKVAAGVSLAQSIPTNIFTTQNLPTAHSKYTDVTITWTSSDPAVLTNAGAIGVSSNVFEDIQLTALVRFGNLTATVVVDVKVWFLAKLTIESVNQKIDSDKEDTVVMFEGKVIGLHGASDNPNSFYVADATGVTYVYGKLPSGINVGDCVKVIGTVKLYVGSSTTQYTREIVNPIIEKISTQITIKQETDCLIEGLLVKLHATTPLTTEEMAAIASSGYLGRLFKITGYVIKVESGSTVNYYLSDTADGTSGKVLYHYQAFNQDVMASYVGKKVTIIAPINDYQATYGFRIGTYISIAEAN